MLIDTSKTERLKHPHEEGQWIDIRPILATELDEAKDRRIKKLLDLWGDTLKNAPGGERKQEPDDLNTRVQQFDGMVLLNAAIVSWSYEAPVNPDNIAKLDGATRDWLIEEVVKRNTRPLAR
jgi:hypothetical protein